MTVEYLAEPYEVIDKPLEWQKLGLQQTASGYGRKLTSRRCIRLSNGRTYRIYITQISNAGSAWIIRGKRKLFLR
jgi:hypothetical protein